MDLLHRDTWQMHQPAPVVFHRLLRIKHDCVLRLCFLCIRQNHIFDRPRSRTLLVRKVYPSSSMWSTELLLARSKGSKISSRRRWNYKVYPPERRCNYQKSSPARYILPKEMELQELFDEERHEKREKAQHVIDMLEQALEEGHGHGPSGHHGLADLFHTHHGAEKPDTHHAEKPDKPPHDPRHTDSESDSDGAANGHHLHHTSTPHRSTPSTPTPRKRGTIFGHKSTVIPPAGAPHKRASVFGGLQHLVHGMHLGDGHTAEQAVNEYHILPDGPPPPVADGEEPEPLLSEPSLSAQISKQAEYAAQAQSSSAPNKNDEQSSEQQDDITSLSDSKKSDGGGEKKPSRWVGAPIIMGHEHRGGKPAREGA